LYNNKLITKSEYNSILNEKLVFNNNHKNKLPYIVDYFKKEFENKLGYPQGVPLQINSSVDYNLTKEIDKLAKDVISGLAWKDV
jgi:membrane peptidoglycan carboxypeptidase